jgi:hypothetical protein
MLVSITSDSTQCVIGRSPGTLPHPILWQDTVSPNRCKVHSNCQLDLSTEAKSYIEITNTHTGNDLFHAKLELEGLASVS